MKRTYQPNNKKASADHGFFARKAAGTGITQARRVKGRKTPVRSYGK